MDSFSLVLTGSVVSSAQVHRPSLKECPVLFLAFVSFFASPGASIASV